MKGLILAFLVGVSGWVSAQPAECSQTPTHQTINSAGSWTTNGDWLSGTKPAYGTNPITIPAGEIVKLSSSNFSVNANLIVNGTLIIDGKLVMPAGNTITVNAGGKISCCTTCGASDKIDIGTGSAEWDGASGPSTINGPASVSNGVLPIDLLYFKGSSGNKINLEWLTASEFNFDYFLLERSANGADFTEIGRVGGHGSSNDLHQYHFTDRSPFTGKNYYRLTSVDFDGFREVFDVLAVENTGEKTATVFPNPSTDGKLTIELSFVPEKGVSIVLTDLAGLEVARLITADQSASFETDLNPGTYLIKISSDGFTKVIRTVVR